MIKELSIGTIIGLLFGFLILGPSLAHYYELSKNPIILEKPVIVTEIVRVQLPPSFEDCLTSFVQNVEQQDRLRAIQELELLK